MTKAHKFLYLRHANGGYGFEASENTDRNDSIAVYRGDLGVHSRAWWRTYARLNNYTLIEVRDTRGK